MRTRLAGEQGKVRTGSKTGFNFIGYQFDLKEGKVRPTPDRWQALTDKIQTFLSGPTVHVPHRASDSHRKASPSRSTSYETHTVALKQQLEYIRITRKGDTSPQVAPPHLRWWLEESIVLPGQPLHPLKHALQIFTDASKEGWGTHLNELIARGTWSLPKNKWHINHLELKAVFLALKEFQDLCSNNIVLVATANTTVVAYINKEWGDEVGPSVCPSVENPDLVYQETGNTQSATHPRPAECDSRQTIQTRPNHSNRMVPSPRGLPSHLFPVAPAPSGPVCHQVQQQTSTVCFTGYGPPSMGSGCTQPVLGVSGSMCLPTSSHLRQSGGEVAGPPMQQNNSDCTGLAQHALVLGPSGHVQSDPTVPTQPAQSGNSAF